LLAFATLLAAAECVVRLTLPAVDPLEYLVAAPRQREAFTDRQQVRIFEADPRLFWRLMPGLDRVVWDGTLVSTNAEHLRHPRPLRPKPSGAFRVVCAGDSVTFGYRVPRVYRRRENDLDQMPYPRRLEQALREANPGRDVEVVALAVPGYSSHQGLLWLGRDLARLQPDLVTLCFGWNDIDRRTATDRQTMPGAWLHVAARRLVPGSQALMHAGLWLREQRSRSAAGGPAARVMRVPRHEFVENMLGMARLAREAGAEVALVAPIYGNPVAHPPEGEDIAGHREALRAAAATAGLPFLEVPELTEKAYPGNAPLFEEHIHPNHRGHRLLAERLARFLADHGLLRGLAAPAEGGGP
jgi:lysophospholipase L1-like esterase